MIEELNIPAALRGDFERKLKTCLLEQNEFWRYVDIGIGYEKRIETIRCNSSEETASPSFRPLVRLKYPPPYSPPGTKGSIIHVFS